MMTSSSSNKDLHNSSNVIPIVPAPVSTNMVITGSPVSSIPKALSSNESFDDFESVKNKKKHKRKRKLVTSSHIQPHIAPPPIISSSSSSVLANAQPVLQDAASQNVPGPK